MRRVAQRLGAGAMTLYSYVANKDDLLDLMADAVMGELVVARPLGRLARGAAADRAEHARDLPRPGWLAELGRRRSSPGPNALMHFEQSLQAVSGLGLDPEQRMAVIAAVDDYVFGFVHREVELERERERDGLALDEYFESIRPWIEDMLATGRYPYLQRYIEEGGSRPSTAASRRASTGCWTGSPRASRRAAAKVALRGGGRTSAAKRTSLTRARGRCSRPG